MEQETSLTFRNINRFSPLICKFTGSRYPSFEMPTTTPDLLNRLKEISTVFAKDGSYNGKSPYAERYALCLWHEGHIEESVKLFDTITSDSQNILMINNPPECGIYPSQEVADCSGKLGYVALWWYATLAPPARAASLCRELVKKIPRGCFPITLADIRWDSLQLLKKLGVLEVCGNPIDLEISGSDRHQLLRHA